MTVFGAFGAENSAETISSLHSDIKGGGQNLRKSIRFPLSVERNPRRCAAGRRSAGPGPDEPRTASFVDRRVRRRDTDFAHVLDHRHRQQVDALSLSSAASRAKRDNMGRISLSAPVIARKNTELRVNRYVYGLRRSHLPPAVSRSSRSGRRWCKLAFHGGAVGDVGAGAAEPLELAVPGLADQRHRQTAGGGSMPGQRPATRRHHARQSDDVEQIEQDDDRDRNADSPKQDAAHDEPRSIEQ